MVVTVVLTGVPRSVPLVDLAYTLDRFLCSDDVGSFQARELPPHRSGKRQVALDFKNGFDAMSAQNILSGYKYQLANDDREYVLSAKITKDPDLMPRPGRQKPDPPSYSRDLVAYGQRSDSAHDELDDQLEILRKQLLIVEKQTKLEKAKKKLKKTKKKHRNPDTDSSDSDSKSRHRSRHRSRHSSRRLERSTSSQSSVSPSRRQLLKEAHVRTPMKKSMSSSLSPEPTKKRHSLPSPPTDDRRSKSPTPPKSYTLTSSDRHVSPHDRRDRKRRRDSPQKHRDSPKRRRDSPRRHRDCSYRRHDSPYRRRDSSRRSHSRNRSRSRSDSPKSYRSYRSPKPSSSRYDAKTAEYLKHYRGSKETYYFSKTDSRRHSYSQAEVVYVSRCQQTLSQRALPSATVTEIRDEDIDRLDEILSDPKMDELNEVVDALTETKTPEHDSEPEERPESPPINRINLEIKVRCTKDITKDVQKATEEDRDFLNLIRLGKIPETKKTKTMPKPIMLDSTGAIKKEILDPEIEKREIEKKKQEKEKRKQEKEKKRLEREKQKQEEYNEMIRKRLPKPIIEDTKMIKKEQYDIDEIIQIDDNDNGRPEKIISSNPRFVIPVIKITKQMKPHTDKVGDSMFDKLLGILRKILRLRIKLLLTDITYYMPSSAITALYRESYSIEDDGELVKSVITDMNEGKFDDFVPSDDEYATAKNGKSKVSDDNANILPYVAGKKKKIDEQNAEVCKDTEMTTLSAVIKKSPRDDDILILEKNVDVIDLSNNEEGNVNSTASATRLSTYMPPQVALVDGIEIKKEIDKEQNIKEEFDLSEINIEDFNMELKEEVNMANVTNEPEKQINTQQPTAIDVKTEPDSVISVVKTETITNGPPVTEDAIAEIEPSQDVNKTVENIVKPDPDASPKMTENTDQNNHDGFVQNVKNEFELVQGNKENYENEYDDDDDEKTKTQSSSKNTDEKISNKPKDTNKPSTKTKHAADKNSDTSKNHEDVAKKVSSTEKEKNNEKKRKKSKKDKDENSDRKKTYKTNTDRKSKEKNDNGDRTKTNKTVTTSDAGTKQKTSEATNIQTDKENPEQQNIVKEEKTEQEECVESIKEFVSLVTEVIDVD